jgi:hypothetical protein
MFPKSVLDHNLRRRCSTSLGPGRLTISGQARDSASRSAAAGLLRNPAQRTKAWIAYYVLIGFAPWVAIASKLFRIYGGDDGARTRDLCRDSLAL